MSGYKTYFMALLVGVLPLVTEKVGAINWNELLLGLGVPDNYVVPAATAVSAIVMIVMRMITQITTVKPALEAAAAAEKPAE